MFSVATIVMNGFENGSAGITILLKFMPASPPVEISKVRPATADCNGACPAACETTAYFGKGASLLKVGYTLEITWFNRSLRWPQRIEPAVTADQRLDAAESMSAIQPKHCNFQEANSKTECSSNDDQYAKVSL